PGFGGWGTLGRRPQAMRGLGLTEISVPDKSEFAGDFRWICRGLYPALDRLGGRAYIQVVRRPGQEAAVHARARGVAVVRAGPPGPVEGKACAGAKKGTQLV